MTSPPRSRTRIGYSGKKAQSCWASALNGIAS